MLFDELRSNINQGAFSSQQVLESGMKEGGGEIGWADCFVKDWKNLIGDTDRYLIKQNPYKISDSLVRRISWKDVEMLVEQTAIMP